MTTLDLRRDHAAKSEPPTLGADEAATLKLISAKPRPAVSPLPGIRRLLSLGLVYSDRPAAADHFVWKITPAGLEWLAANDLLSAPLTFTTGPITVSHSLGTHPITYLMGPPTPPFVGLGDVGTQLATVSSHNPNRVGDATLWAHAWETRQALADLLDAVTHGRGVRPHDVALNTAVHQAAAVLEKTAG